MVAECLGNWRRRSQEEHVSCGGFLEVDFARVCRHGRCEALVARHVEVGYSDRYHSGSLELRESLAFGCPEESPREI